MAGQLLNPSKRAVQLAERILQGANALADFAESLSEAEWKMHVPGESRTVGVIIHHVASVYPIEVELAKALADGQAITATKADVDAMNAKHAEANQGVGKGETLELLRQNSSAAVDSVKAFTDEELDNAAPVALNADAPLTAQFFIEDHALRHSFHHLARLKEALGK